VAAARDLGRFYRALLAGRVLAPEQLAAMKTGGQYGLGLFKIETSCGEAWGHNGALPGSLAHAYAGRERQVVVLVDEQPLGKREAAAVNRTLDAAVCS
jgi:D-alanyl-D-alanine carboxypeptidase